MSKEKILSALCYPLWFIMTPLYFIKYRDNLVMRFHLIQSLRIIMTIGLILICWLVLSIFLIMVPLIGPLFSAFLMANIIGLGLFFIYLIIKGILNALNSLERDLPLVNWVYKKLFSRKRGEINDSI